MSKRSKTLTLAITEELFQELKKLQLEKIIETKSSITISSFVSGFIEEAIKNRGNKNENL